MKVFIDTWGWITLFNKREKRHEEITKWYLDFRRQKGTIHTTDYVFDETFTLIFRRISVDIAVNAMKKIEESIEKGYIILDRITSERFDKAKELRLKYRDKPLISFTDLTSIIAMSETGIDRILTEDEHFRYLETHFQRVP
jgi:uncharacterized protein